MVERRQHPRYPFAQTVELELLSADRLGNISDISLGGAFIATPKALPLRTLIRVVVSHRDGRRIAIPAEVVWVVLASQTGQEGMGIEWGLLEKEQKNLIQEAIEMAQST